MEEENEGGERRDAVGAGELAILVGVDADEDGIRILHTQAIENRVHHSAGTTPGRLGNKRTDVPGGEEIDDHESLFAGTQPLRETAVRFDHS